jgi:hypothetical protein
MEPTKCDCAPALAPTAPGKLSASAKVKNNEGLPNAADVAKSFAPTTVAVLRSGSADGGLASELASATAPTTAKAVVSYWVLVNSIGTACAPMAIDASSAARNLVATVTPS